MTETDVCPASNPENSGEDASIENVAEASETRKKSRKPLLGLLLILAIGALLFSPAISTPLFLDDHLQGAMVEGTFPAARGPFDLYNFVDEGARASLTQRGLLPWWAHPHLKIRFFRPLASALPVKRRSE